MKKIEVSIKPNGLEAVKQSLSELGVTSITLSEIHQLGATSAPRKVYRGSAYVEDCVTLLRLELVVPAHLVDGIVDAIRRSAESSCADDALVLVSEAGEAFRLRSGKSGDAAFVPTPRRAPQERPRALARRLAWLT